MGAAQPRLLSDEEWADVFAEFDVDRSGTLTRREAVQLVHRVAKMQGQKKPLDTKFIDRIVGHCDVDKDGSISCAELKKTGNKFIQKSFDLADEKRRAKGLPPLAEADHSRKPKPKRAAPASSAQSRPPTEPQSAAQSDAVARDLEERAVVEAQLAARQREEEAAAERAARREAEERREAAEAEVRKLQREVEAAKNASTAVAAPEDTSARETENTVAPQASNSIQKENGQSAAATAALDGAGAVRPVPSAADEASEHPRSVEEVRAARMEADARRREAALAPSPHAAVGFDGGVPALPSSPQIPRSQVAHDAPSAVVQHALGEMTDEDAGLQLQHLRRQVNLFVESQDRALGAMEQYYQAEGLSRTVESIFAAQDEACRVQLPLGRPATDPESLGPLSTAETGRLREISSATLEDQARRANDEFFTAGPPVPVAGAGPLDSDGPAIRALQAASRESAGVAGAARYAGPGPSGAPVARPHAYANQNGHALLRKSARCPHCKVPIHGVAVWHGGACLCCGERIAGASGMNYAEMMLRR